MENRNIIVIGPKNSGKSTIASKILMRSDYPLRPKEIVIRNTEKVISDKQYKITVLDTTGFSTVAMSRERASHLKEFLRMHNIDTIHLVIFVIRAGRLTGDDRRNLESIMGYFKRIQLSTISALFITHCEQYNEKKKQDIVTQFKLDNFTSTIGSLARRGVITTGFAAPDDYDQGLLTTLEADNRVEVENINNIIAEADDGVQTTELFQLTILERLYKSCLIL